MKRESVPINHNAAAKTFQELGRLDIRTAENYLHKFSEILNLTIVTFDYRPKEKLSLNQAVERLSANLLENHRNKKKIMIVGNGGSAGVAIHMLADYANAGGLKTADFYSPSMLTCMANDYGYENVFAGPVELFAEAGDILFAISSSGKSDNIIKACQAADSRDCEVVTFSGFDPDNPLRKAGRLNFYVPSTHYGFVESAHQALLHCILDLFIRTRLSDEARKFLS